MALETGNYIYDLVITNPTSSDAKSQGDDHFRLEKTVLKTSINGWAGNVLITGNDTGAADAYVLTPSPALPGYVDRMILILDPANANTGASTVNISALGAKSLKTVDGAALTAADLVVGYQYAFIYDGTDFRMLGTVTKRYIDAALALKAALASPALTGTPTAPTAAVGTNTTQIATTAYVIAQAFSTALPSQTGNSGKFVTTDGSTASWATVDTSVYSDATYWMGV